MVKLNGPMFSLGASGTLAKAVTFASWKGRAYARGTVIPANPKAEKQISVRAMMKFLSQQWDGIYGPNKDTWDDLADAHVVSTFNAYIGTNLARWRNFLGPSQMHPPATTQTPPTLGTATAVGGVRMITVTQEVMAPEDGWAVLFFRKTGSAVTPAFDNLVAVKAIDGVNDVVFVDTPLEHGTYHYDFYSLTQDGQLTDQTQPVSAIASA